VTRTTELDLHNLRAYRKLGVEAGTEDEIDATWCALYGRCILKPSEFPKLRREAVTKCKLVKYVIKRRVL
jgi:hypothetical protein